MPHSKKTGSQVHLFCHLGEKEKQMGTITADACGVKYTVQTNIT